MIRVLLLIFFFVLTNVCVGAVKGEDTSSRVWIDATMYGELAVVIPENASPILQRAAEVFQKYWEACTRKSIPIANKNQARINVWLGVELCTQEWLEPEELEDLGEEGFIIRTYTPVKKYAERGVGKQLLICGKTDLGTLRGVYTFFEKYLDVAWIATNYIHTPMLRFSLEEIDYRYIPHFPFRYVLSNQPEFQYEGERKEGLHLSLSPPEKDFINIMMSELLPSKNEDTLCFMNDLIQETIYQELKYRIDKDTERKFWSISVPLGFPLCGCDRCTSIIKEYETDSAPLLSLFNRVAERLAHEYPDREISLCLTLRGRLIQAPKQGQFHQSLCICLSTEMCDWARALDDPKSITNKEFYENLRRWRAITPRVLVRYVTGVNYHNGLFLSPDWVSLQRNLQAMDQVGILGIIVEVVSSKRWLYSDWDVIKSYLLPKLLWDPDRVLSEELRKTFDFYYRQASKPLLEYFSFPEVYIRETEVSCGYYQKRPWWNKKFMEKVLPLVTNAIQLTQTSQDIYLRVVRCAVPAYYSAWITPPEVQLEGNSLRQNYLTAPKKEDISSMIEFLEKNLHRPEDICELYREVLERTLMETREPGHPRVTYSIDSLENEGQIAWILPEVNGAIIRAKNSYTGVELINGDRYGTGFFHIWSTHTSIPKYAYEAIAYPQCTVVERGKNHITLEKTISPEITLVQSLALNDDIFQLGITCINKTDQPKELLLYVVPSFAILPRFPPPFSIPLDEYRKLGWTINDKKRVNVIPIRLEPCSIGPKPLGKTDVTIDINRDLLIQVVLQGFPLDHVDLLLDYSFYDGYISPIVKIQKNLSPHETISGIINIHSSQDYGLD